MILHLPLTDCEEGPSLCTQVMTAVAVLLVIITFPFSLLLVVKVVQASKISHFCEEYQVSFRSLRERLYSVLAACCLKLVGQVCSLFSRAWMHMRLLI
jgi:hypothetical protein